LATVEIVPALSSHALRLAPFLRKEDVAEVRALGMDPTQALLDSVSNSSEAFAVSFDGELSAIFGVVPARETLLGSSDVGQIWMLSGEGITRHRKAFLRVSRWVVAQLLQRYRLLWNVIDARYAGALRWARWLGFEVMEARPAGPFNMLFCPFIVRRP
jgi:hypothetical protein